MNGALLAIGSVILASSGAYLFLIDLLYPNEVTVTDKLMQKDSAPSHEAASSKARFRVRLAKSGFLLVWGGGVTVSILGMIGAGASPS